ncbi:ABC transporter substrate-binding protein [Saccharopolyspora sp. K220]|uniref:ABC transporter substrate-binding protein n=1 Tax=Saccharopolyspora soli TaxID=2926618 RepID=UPI001F597B69|nr:ABC transporter substrate-binding protein [Saccharopolyspora soli]MCI2419346.1 ABC transporter substrate-binding protein [Saccharopolyspora soli]
MTRHRHPRWLAAGALGCATLAVIAGCGGAPVSPSQAKQNVRLVDSTPAASGPLDKATWFMPKEPATLDQDNDAAGATTDTVMGNVCERLVQVQPDLTIKPWLAEKFEWTTPTTLVFTIRQGVRFHSGNVMTADDVVWSMNRHRADGANESDEFVNVTGVSQTGPNEVTVTTTQSDAVFVKALSGTGGVVFERKAVEAQGDTFGTPRGDDACTGPLDLKSWDSGRQIVLTKFADYWNKERVSKTGELTIRWADDDAVVNSLLTGEADGAYLENIASAAGLANAPNTTVSQGADTRVWNSMVTERGALADPRLRKALSLALDRDGVSRAALAGLGVPASEPVGSGAWGYQADKFRAASQELAAGAPATPTAQNIEAAKKLVAEVGNTQQILVASDGTTVRDVIANAVVTAAKEIGLDARIIQFPPQQYGDYYSDANFRKQADLFTDDYFVSKNDPVGFYKNGASDSSVNWVLNDPEYDALVQQGKAELDDVKRADLAIDLANRWAEAMPWLSVVQSPTTVVLSTDVTGVPASGAFRNYPWAADLGAKGQ